MNGYIVKGIGGFYYVKTPDGIVECKPRGIFRKQKITPVAGDEVTLETENDAAVIAQIEPRKNVFVRPPVANLGVTDVLMYQPDFVMVDFSVNDEPDEFFQETYEGVIRKLLQWKSEPAVVILNNVFYDTGKTAQDFHNAVGNWYQVPHVSMKDTLYQEIQQGKYTREELTPDGLHPNDKGHKLVAEKIIAFLEEVRSHMAEPEDELTIPEPMTQNAYQNARRLTIREISPELAGLRADTEEKTGHLDHFKNGWIGKKPGDKVTFETEGSCIAVQYRKTIHKPALRAKLVLDGDRANEILLDANFDEDWGDCLYLEPILHHGENKTHTVEIEILPDNNKDATPFYLMSLTVA